MIVSLPNYTPPPRYDDLPWTIARLQSSSTQGGTYALVEDFDLDPLDTDPANPEIRDFTTTLGTASLWYRFLWVDAAANTSGPTTPGQNLNGVVPGGVTAYATAAELATTLNLTTATAAAKAALLQRALDAAALEIDSEVGRNDLSGAELALAGEVNIERAVEYWHARPVGFNIVGLDSEAPVRLSRNSWEPYAHKLSPLKESWGLA